MLSRPGKSRLKDSNHFSRAPSVGNCVSMAGPTVPSVSALQTMRRAVARYSLSNPQLGCQRRHAQVHDVRFLATHVPHTQKVYDKYREQLERKARSEGHESVEGLKEAYKSKINALRQRASIPAEETPQPPPEQQQQSAHGPSQASPPPRKPQTSSLPSVSKVKTLSSFLDIEKTLALPPEEISQIWRVRFASNPNSLCATIPSQTYHRLMTTAQKHPMFILPLPRAAAQLLSGSDNEHTQPTTAAAGALPPASDTSATEIHFLQFAHPSPTTTTILFTHLAEYRLRGEHSQPHTTITHHTDLSLPKGLILLEGQVVPGRGVSVDEARWLLMCLQKFYLMDTEQQVARGRKRELLEMFSRGDERFRVEDLVEEAERI